MNLRNPKKCVFVKQLWLLFATAFSVAAVADVTLNELRTFTTNDQTRFTLDDEPISEARLGVIGSGFVARVSIAADVAADFSSGTALAIDLDNLLKGPVTSLDPLTVLHQPVIVTGDTLLADLPGNGVSGLAVGDIVEVSGFADAANSVRATRLEYKPNGTPEWKLTGIVSSVTTERLSIGAQVADLASVVVRDCDAGLGPGRLVEIKAAADSGYSSGDVLAALTDVECLSPGLAGPAGGLVPAAIEGLVTSVVSSDTILVGGQRVLTTSATVFRDGGADDLVLGVRLEAQGQLDVSSGVLTATRISFRESPVRIEAPVAPGAVAVGESITLLGITALGTEQTQDEDAILSGGLAQSRQVEIRGFLDRRGQVFVTRVRERGDPEADDYRLRGPVAAVNPPQFVIMGVTIDTRNSLLPAEFFNRIGVATQVEIEDARYDPLTNTLSGGSVELELSSSTSRRNTLPGTALAARSGGLAGAGIGTVTRIGGASGNDLILSSDFENVD